MAIPSQRLISACTEKLVGGLSSTRHFEVNHSVLLADSLRPISARLSATKSSALRRIVPTRVGFLPQSLEMAAGCVDWKSPALSRASKSECWNITKRLSLAATEDSPKNRSQDDQVDKGVSVDFRPIMEGSNHFLPTNSGDEKAKCFRKGKLVLPNR